MFWSGFLDVGLLGLGFCVCVFVGWLVDCGVGRG